MNINNYLEQHKAITDEINKLRMLIKDDLVEKAAEMAATINTLAGKIKIHLLSEDKYFYPALEKNEDKNIRNLAKDYQEEMGTLAEGYTTFKEKYNTQSKIIKNQEEFPRDLENILNQIEKRISKEEKGLYKSIS